jgi:hypothetical protein
MELICRDSECARCGANPEQRTCCACGVQGIVTDCGHYAQPRPIAAGRVNGTDMQHDYCSACADVPTYEIDTPNGPRIEYGPHDDAASVEAVAPAGYRVDWQTPAYTLANGRMRSPLVLSVMCEAGES